MQIYGKRSLTVGRCKATEGTINQLIVVTTSGYSFKIKIVYFSLFQIHRLFSLVKRDGMSYHSLLV